MEQAGAFWQQLPLVLTKFGAVQRLRSPPQKGQPPPPPH
jgi:hypothetical protein